MYNAIVSTAYWGTILATAGIALIVSLIYSSQEKLLYFPDTKTMINPQSYFDPDKFEEIYLTTSDGIKVQTWFFRQENSKNVPTLLFCHSNAGNLSHRLDNIKNLFDNVNINVFILSYRGYGFSEGTPSEPGLKKDIDACMEYLLSDPLIDPNQIICFGRSLGGAVAIDTAKRYPNDIKALILENTFTSVPDMVDEVLPMLKLFKPFCRNRWESNNAIKDVRCDILFLSAKNDELVPSKHMTSLAENAKHSKKKIIVFEDGAHMTLMFQKNYYKFIKEFLDSVFIN
ncbi:hypothetical protein DICPUDRAFT_94792 [Dictyostelium purpureum]|uniref:AB hydrolase-1 domain-containing protein n=1 Tax=Dictyostelium purpureum TaxID=5786 RepID=F0ZNK1_DICPU|nr:uncharacterized protein DICPUDRAFT_94792 [Dictyostelium purpureum]EGC34458.1 hypothetical protein DICPUDRAFT_94792 [Dictyostelium purpureum]|eukprot:XP_003288993.1 hypothetical protein DICPUDRAFT_94792 [Dictyostelium purpureum]